MHRPGWAAPYFASLASPEAIARLQEALGAFEGGALGHGAKPVWREGVTPEPLRDARLLRVAVAVAALARELGRWENEGGAVGPRGRDSSGR